jgi:truncated hemoglobin YjbI
MADCHSNKPGIAQALFDSAFQPGRDPRSAAYKAGVLAGLRYHSGVGPKPQHAFPYELGTAEADAWFAGLNEAALRWRIHLSNEQE